jgi:hypothetical protein
MESSRSSRPLNKWIYQPADFGCMESLTPSLNLPRHPLDCLHILAPHRSRKTQVCIIYSSHPQRMFRSSNNGDTHSRVLLHPSHHSTSTAVQSAQMAPHARSSSPQAGCLQERSERRARWSGWVPNPLQRQTCSCWHGRHRKTREPSYIWRTLS